jgi:superfamily II DNA or RNA helicase
VTGLALRPYQADAVDSVFAGWDRGVQRLGAVAPTGAGKTVIFSSVIERAHARGCRRTVLLAHRDELLGQAMAKLASVAPHLRAGVVAAGRDESHARVVYASVQTVANPKRLARLKNVGLLVVDEGHHATAPSYRRVMEGLGCFTTGGALALGVTATMERADGAKLGDVWQELAFEIPIKPLIDDGYLVKPRGIHVRIDDLDLDTVKRSRGDFADGDLGRAMTDSMAPDRIVEAIQNHAEGRQGILFAPTVDFAELMAQRLNEAGLPAAVVTGRQPMDERRATLEAFRAGKVQWLTNCMVLTEGTDLPMAEVCVIARPTKSRGLYIQMAGRVLRPWPGKRNALVLDVVGVSKRMRLASLAALDLSDVEEATDTVDGLLVEDEPGLDDLLVDGESTDDSIVEYRDGRLVSEYVDLFGTSHAAWLQTDGGIWFLPAGLDLIAIIPDPTGGWMVIRASPTPGVSWGIERGVQDMSYAMSYGEANVTGHEQMLTVRDARWRKQKPSARLKATAREHGIVVTADMRCGDVNDAILIRRASARLDARISYAR